jgi:probable addiction module antidote protein
MEQPMNAVFTGGSRHVSRLPTAALERLDNVIENRLPVLVGDANGADKAVQMHLADNGYEPVTVFCTGVDCRNNLGAWTTRHIDAPNGASGFQFYAAKDREMAREAEFGLMIWDGMSPGTVLNVLRLVRAGKKALLINVPAKTQDLFKSSADWDSFLAHSAPSLRADLRKRATNEEWKTAPQLQPSLSFETAASGAKEPALSDAALEAGINAALASGDPKRAVDLLGHIARARGMSQLAKTTGLAREALYRALSQEGNPEFATVLKVMDSLGLQLTVNRQEPGQSLQH